MKRHTITGQFTFAFTISQLSEAARKSLYHELKRHYGKEVEEGDVLDWKTEEFCREHNLKGKFEWLSRSYPTVNHLISAPKHELLALKNFGPKSLSILNNRLLQYGLSLREE